MPASWLYGAGVAVRNKLYDMGWLKSRSFDLPVISVGNITVGGTGKTPHIEYLASLLGQFFRVAVLSRGYRRHSSGFVLADSGKDYLEVGDEPCQISRKFPDAVVAVDEDRCHGIDTIVSDMSVPPVDVVLLDDAYQHRAVRPGRNILLVDYNRLLCDDCLLPAGRLREPEKGKDRANIVIITKCPQDINPMQMRLVRKKMDLYPYQKLFFTTMRYGKLYPITLEGLRYNLASVNPGVGVLLVTGIARPEPLEAEIGRYCDNLVTMRFPDHHEYVSDDIDGILSRFDSLPQGGRMIITTEKDAVRLAVRDDIPQEVKKLIYVLPIEVEFIENKQYFNDKIIEYVRNNQKNSGIFTR